MERSEDNHVRLRVSVAHEQDCTLVRGTSFLTLSRLPDGSLATERNGRHWLRDRYWCVYLYGSGSELC